MQTAHERLLSKRKSLGLTQSAMAERLKIDSTWLSRIERGHFDELPVTLALRIELLTGIPMKAWARAAA